MDVSSTTLENGLRVVTHSMPHLETVSIGVWVGTGSRCESEEQHGIAHFLEHMAFKGTQSRSAKEIAEHIESVGGDLNAATSLETTAFYARVLKENLSLGLELLSDILINPTFEPAELERERHVIIQEISATQDSPDEVVYDLAQEYAFPSQALGRPIIGTIESVHAIDADDLRAFRASRYSADGMVLAAAGCLHHDDVVACAADQFGGIARFDRKAPQKAAYRGGICRAPQTFEQSHMVVVFEGPSYKGDDFYTVQILSTILGGGMSSRLFQEAREVRGLCYSIYAFCWAISDTGLIGAHVATAPDQLEELLDVMTGEMRRMAEEASCREEIARAKAQLKAGLLMSLESSGARAEQLARQTLAFGAPLAIDEVIAKIDAVSGDAVQFLAKKVFDGCSPTLASTGPANLSVDGSALQRKFDPCSATAAK